MIDFNKVLLQWFIIFFNERSSDSAVTHALLETLVLRDKSAIKSEAMPNQQLAEDLS